MDSTATADWLESAPKGDWLEISGNPDIRPGAKLPGETRRAEVVQAGAMPGGRDRVWFTDGEYIWFRRAKSNPATLRRHDGFTADGDYEYIETQDDVEIYKLKPQSRFKAKASPKLLDLGDLDFYNVKRQAALAAVRRDFKTFHEIVSWIREMFMAQYHAGHADMLYAECYASLMAMIEQRLGPSPGEINRELMKLMAGSGQARGKIITIGR